VGADVAVDAHPYVEELWELGLGVTEHRHHCRAYTPGTHARKEEE
jgi:hypothetical protein